MVSASDILNAKILVVDDKPANVQLIERMLRGAGYTSVESTTDPCAVCDLHRRNRYSLILLDLQMPGMDGFQVMEGLKEIEGDGYLPVLVITAQPAHKLRALEAGAKDFVSKPFDLAELRARVRNILEVRLLHLKAQASTAECWRKRCGNWRPAARLIQQRRARRNWPSRSKRKKACCRAACRSLRISAFTLSIIRRAMWAGISTISCNWGRANGWGCWRMCRARGCRRRC